MLPVNGATLWLVQRGANQMPLILGFSHVHVTTMRSTAVFFD